MGTPKLTKSSDKHAYRVQYSDTTGGAYADIRAVIQSELLGLSFALSILIVSHPNWFGFRGVLAFREWWAYNTRPRLGIPALQRSL